MANSLRVPCPARKNVEKAAYEGVALQGAGNPQRRCAYAAGNDPPLVNLAEGGVLLEMKEAMRLFGEANAKHPAVKKLTPGLATRRVLARHAAKKAETEAPKPVVP